MKLGFSACNFPYRSWEESIAFAAENGFDFIEGYGPGLDAILAMDKGGDTAALLRKYGLAMTVHHALPDPADGDKCTAFRQAMVNLRDFVRRENVVSVLSFDTWVDRAGSLPNLLYVLDLFRDTDIPILTEDFPLNEKDLQLWDAAKAYPHWGLLSDLGHTNVRLSDVGAQQVWCLWNENEGAPLEPGDNSPAAFRYAWTKKPLPVVQVHVHNNDGTGDTHHGVPEGTADFAAIVPMLRRLGFDGYADLELSPTIHGITGAEADRLLLRDRDLWRQYWDL